MTEDETCPNCQGPKNLDHRMCDVCYRTLRAVPSSTERPPLRGISDLVAVALIALNLDTVRRTTIRNLCPAQGAHRETGQPTKLPIRQYVSNAIWKLERRGGVRRDGLFVHVLDRDALRSWIDQGVDLTDERAAEMLNVEEAARKINARLDEGTAVSGWDAETARRHTEVRRQELLALDRLIRAMPGGTARPGVRIVPRGRAL